MKRKRLQQSSSADEPGRQGTPFTVYFSDEQANALSVISRERRVSKATLVRYAVERLLDQIENERVRLPLGL